ncbi:MAG: O-antigen ligase family protein [Hyphomicrobiaceae bacterium]
MIKSAYGPREAKPANTVFAARRLLTAIPLITLFYVLLILAFMIDTEGQGRPLNNLFWPAAAALILALAFRNRSRVDTRFFRSLPILSLGAYLLFALASVSWAYSPESAFSRIAVHILICIVLLVPYSLPIGMTNTIPTILLIYAGSLAVNAIYVLTYPPSPIGHPGYFLHKQDLGMLGAVALISSAHQLLFGRWWLRMIAAVSCATAIWLIIESESKSATAFAFASLILAWPVLVACKWLRATPAFIVGAFVIASLFVNNPLERMGYRIYGDSTLTGRTGIWQFIEYQISQRAWFGWGFHSFFFVPNSPMAKAPGYIADMPSSHSGFLELRLETGRIGYVIFLVFIYATLHALERVRRQDAARAWFYLSVVIFALLINLTDSHWLVLNHLWVLYLIVVGETVRYAHESGVAQKPTKRVVRGALCPSRKTGPSTSSVM